MPSIKKRIVASYLLVILLTVVLLETLMLMGIRHYYVVNVQNILEKQAEVASHFYWRYLSGQDLNKNATTLLEGFASTTAAQVQIFNAVGMLLADSHAMPNQALTNLPDVQKALAGSTGVWRTSVPSTGEPVLAVAYPLRSGLQVVGAVRFVTSLTPIHQVVQKAAVILIVLGLVVVLLAAVVSLLLTATITGPILKITQAAEQMAAGDFNVRAPKKYHDEIGRLADTLNYLAQEVVRHNQLKDQFIASVSHELRTPLTSIKGWTVTIHSGGLASHDETKEGLAIIEKECDRLTLLVDELLDFSRLSAGKITLQKEQLDLPRLLDNIVQQLSPRARRQKINLNYTTDADLPALLADPNRLKQVIINLIDNALKFTPAGGSINISADIYDGQVQIKIADTGSGISPAQLPKIKQKFYKGASSTGSGIGLSVCDEIIKLHQGQLIINSRPNQGTEVLVTLPTHGHRCFNFCAT